MFHLSDASNFVMRCLSHGQVDILFRRPVQRFRYLEWWTTTVWLKGEIIPLGNVYSILECTPHNTLLPLPEECALRSHCQYRTNIPIYQAMNLVKSLPCMHTFQCHSKCLPDGVYTPSHHCNLILFHIYTHSLQCQPHWFNCAAWYRGFPPKENDIPFEPRPAKV